MKPPSIKPGDLVGICSPAIEYYAVSDPFLTIAEKNLARLGLNWKYSANAFDRSPQLSLSARKRAQDLNDLFSDPEIKAIFCMSGGCNVNSVLPWIDWEAVSRNPKILLGYSANTVLLLGIYAKTGLVTFHGPHVLDGFAEYPEPFSYTVEQLERLLIDGEIVSRFTEPEVWTDDFPKTDQPRNVKRNRRWKWLKQGCGEGTLIGGNLSMMRTIISTEYWPDFQNSILFIEEVDTGGMTLKSIDESLTHLRLAGVFDQISGLVVGKMHGLTDEEEALLEEILLIQTESCRFPILCQVDLGHTDPKLTLPIGIQAVLDSYSGRFGLKEKAVTFQKGKHSDHIGIGNEET
jgi:muramoyltetrapeptide carboxypeptidase LdcA involved in peptidoglycan recycling